MAHQFGGEWTKEKLLRLQKYLKAYTTIFNSNEKARKLHFMYVDAFAGTGSFQKTQSQVTGQADIFSDNVPEVEEFLKGSARIALEINPPFREYIFIERNLNMHNNFSNLKTNLLATRFKLSTKMQIRTCYDGANRLTGGQRGLLFFSIHTAWKLNGTSLKR
ncbi:three-Cys-motif partner protein TcmP [Chloroflexus sp. MS-CIW-1]|nr:three-Cys-motif partner protein TcmP [Chloroflexus sp. MS-CIW-1]MDN5273609.1 three-Cys-motif partner protein TcmP [Chloroflexus sp. MS-CIW-1]